LKPGLHNLNGWKPCAFKLWVNCIQLVQPRLRLRLRLLRGLALLAAPPRVRDRLRVQLGLDEARLAAASEGSSSSSRSRPRSRHARPTRRQDHSSGSLPICGRGGGRGGGWGLLRHRRWSFFGGLGRDAVNCCRVRRPRCPRRARCSRRSSRYRRGWRRRRRVCNNRGCRCLRCRRHRSSRGGWCFLALHVVQGHGGGGVALHRPRRERRHPRQRAFVLAFHASIRVCARLKLCTASLFSGALLPAPKTRMEVWEISIDVWSILASTPPVRGAWVVHVRFQQILDTLYQCGGEPTCPFFAQRRTTVYNRNRKWFYFKWSAPSAASFVCCYVVQYK
jgi:hypothetical protein